MDRGPPWRATVSPTERPFRPDLRTFPEFRCAEGRVLEVLAPGNSTFAIRSVSTVTHPLIDHDLWQPLLARKFGLKARTLLPIRLPEDDGLSRTRIDTYRSRIEILIKYDKTRKVTPPTDSAIFFIPFLSNGRHSLIVFFSCKTRPPSRRIFDSDPANPLRSTYFFQGITPALMKSRVSAHSLLFSPFPASL